MGALGNGGGLWWQFPPGGGSSDERCRRRLTRQPKSSSSESINLQRNGWLWSLQEYFPLQQAAVAASLTLTGDTIAQLSARGRRGGTAESEEEVVDIADFPSFFPGNNKASCFASIRNGICISEQHARVQGSLSSIVSGHDWVRALRMASYGFLLYGPGSHAWYQLLDHCMPTPTLITTSVKVLLNQIVLGPCVIAVIFAWNNFWLGKLAELPSKYQKDALPTLLYGFRFWIPVTIVNFAMIPLSTRVAFMSTCSVFWNFYLSTTMSK